MRERKVALSQVHNEGRVKLPLQCGYVLKQIRTLRRYSRFLQIALRKSIEFYFTVIVTVPDVIVTVLDVVT